MSILKFYSIQLNFLQCHNCLWCLVYVNISTDLPTEYGDILEISFKGSYEDLQEICKYLDEVTVRIKLWKNKYVV
jgi:hypothetical protein